MDIIKCNVCKLDIKTCNYKCVEMDDVSSLYKDGMSEKDALHKFCTAHKCPHNVGMRCTAEKCCLDLPKLTKQEEEEREEL